MLGNTDVGFGGGPSAARDVLSAIAGSFVTVSGVTFSLTVVVLQLASSQYGPRILRGFLADRITQLTAGAFIGVFAYALVVLRSVRDAPSPFVPSLGVSLAIALALVALVLLLVFIDHVTKLIQVSNLAARIGEDTSAELRRLSERASGLAEVGDRVGRWRSERRGLPVHVARPGYLRSVDTATMQRELSAAHARVVLLVGPGDLVVLDEPVAEAWWENPGADESMDHEDVVAAVVAGLHVANERDLQDDPGFEVRQLADIAIRALSPGINDPTTAVTCIGYARAALVEELALPPQRRLVEGCGVEIVLAARGFERDSGALADIAHHASGEPCTASAVQRAVEAVASAARERGRPVDAARVEAAHRAACGGDGVERDGYEARASSRAPDA